MSVREVEQPPRDGVSGDPPGDSPEGGVPSLGHPVPSLPGETPTLTPEQQDYLVSQGIVQVPEDGRWYKVTRLQGGGMTMIPVDCARKKGWTGSSQPRSSTISNICVNPK